MKNYFVLYGSGKIVLHVIQQSIFCMRCIRKCPKGGCKVDEEIISMEDLSFKEMCSVKKENELFL